MELYGSYTSPFVRHCRIALLESGLKCDFIETDLVASGEGSPTKKVPFLKDGDLVLTDSSSILKYLREKAGGSFCADVRDYDLFCMVNTVLDASVNLFFLERDDKLGPAQSSYLTRHKERVASALSELNALPWPQSLAAGPMPLSDGQLRLACFLAWGLFRKRIELAQYSALAAFLTVANQYSAFAETAPPAV